MPQYVIQEHHQSENRNQKAESRNLGVHYDFMLESGDILKTWRIPQSPDHYPQKIEQIQDHRKIYLDYEGEISGNRGFVKIWDKGDYAILTWTDQIIEIQLSGIKLQGTYQLKLITIPIWDFLKHSNA